MTDSQQIDLFAATDLTQFKRPRPEVISTPDNKQILVRRVELEGTPADAAKLLNCSVQSIYNIIQEGDIETRPATGLHREFERDSLGRKPHRKLICNMLDVYRLKYGADFAESLSAALGMN